MRVQKFRYLHNYFQQVVFTHCIILQFKTFQWKFRKEIFNVATDFWSSNIFCNFFRTFTFCLVLNRHSELFVRFSKTTRLVALVRSTGISISNRHWNEFWKFAYLFLNCKRSKTDYWLEVWTTSLPLTSSIQLLQILKVAKVAIRYQDCSINSLLRRVQIFSLQNVLERADINNVSNLIMHEGHL